MGAKMKEIIFSGVISFGILLFVYLLKAFFKWVYVKISKKTAK